MQFRSIFLCGIFYRCECIQPAANKKFENHKQSFSIVHISVLYSLNFGYLDNVSASYELYLIHLNICHSDQRYLAGKNYLTSFIDFVRFTESNETKEA